MSNWYVVPMSIVALISTRHKPISCHTFTKLEEGKALK